jgi:hypothetical protein
MAGVLTTDGKVIIANLAFKQSEPNCTQLYLGLFTNSSGLSSASVLSAITTPSGGGYASIALTNSSWTTTAGLAAYAAQTWTASGAVTGTIYGYYIFTAGTTPKLVGYEINTAAGPITMASGDTYAVTPNLQVG